MSRAPACRLASFALVAVLSTTACARTPSTETGPNGIPMSEAATSPRTVGGHTYTTEPVEARVGPRRFMFPANLYYNQTAPHDRWGRHAQGVLAGFRCSASR